MSAHADAGVLDGQAAGRDGCVDQLVDQASSLARVSLISQVLRDRLVVP